MGRLGGYKTVNIPEWKTFFKNISREKKMSAKYIKAFKNSLAQTSHTETNDVTTTVYNETDTISKRLKASKMSL